MPTHPTGAGTGSQQRGKSKHYPPDQDWRRPLFYEKETSNGQSAVQDSDLEDSDRMKVLHKIPTKSGLCQHDDVTTPSELLETGKELR